MPHLILPRPHSPQQHTFYFPPAQINICTAGSKFGKTVGGCGFLVKQAWEHPGCICRWVAPIYRQSKIALRLMSRMIPPEVGKINRGDLEIRLANRSVIQFVSADRPETLEGEGVHFFVFDEAAKASEDAWESHFSTLSATDAIGWVISTPKGRNWFWRLAQAGIDPRQHDFAFFRFPTSMNPHIRPSVIERARLILPVRSFEEIFLAFFRDEAGGVFENVDACATMRGAAEPVLGQHYVLGVDVAKVRDWTVATMMDRHGRVVAWDRFQRISWGEQVERIHNFARGYQAQIEIDSTGVGDPIFDALKERGNRINGHHFTNLFKQQIIENLRSAIAEGIVSYPQIPEMLNELKAFEHRLLGSGLIRYAAPVGSHDDCVMSLALAYWGVRGYSSVAHEVTIEPEPLFQSRLRGAPLRETNYGTA